MKKAFYAGKTAYRETAGTRADGERTEIAREFPALNAGATRGKPVNTVLAFVGL